MVDHAAHLRSQHRRVLQPPRRGQLQQLGIGHRRPQEVGEARSHGVLPQRAHPRPRIHILHFEQEPRRDQHRLQRQLHVLFKRVAPLRAPVIQRQERLHVGLRHRLPERLRQHLLKNPPRRRPRLHRRLPRLQPQQLKVQRPLFNRRRHRPLIHRHAVELDALGPVHHRHRMRAPRQRRRRHPRRRPAARIARVGQRPHLHAIHLHRHRERRQLRPLDGNANRVRPLGEHRHRGRQLRPRLNKPARLDALRRRRHRLHLMRQHHLLKRRRNDNPVQHRRRRFEIPFEQHRRHIERVAIGVEPRPARLISREQIRRHHLEPEQIPDRVLPLPAVQPARRHKTGVVASGAARVPQPGFNPIGHGQPVRFGQRRPARRHRAVPQLRRHIAPQRPLRLDACRRRRLQKVQPVPRIGRIVALRTVGLQHRPHLLGELIGERQNAK